MAHIYALTPPFSRCTYWLNSKQLFLHGGEKGLGRCDMGRTAPLTSAANKIYQSYRRGDYQHVYHDRCGESDTYRDSAIDLNFRKYIPANPSDSGETIFKNFLNDGRNCHESSPARRAITITDAIKSLTDSLLQFKTWRQYFDAFVDYIDRLSPHVTAAHEKPSTAKQQQTIIGGVIAGFEPYAKKLDEGINQNDFQKNLPSPLSAIIDAQVAAARSMRSTALALKLEVDPPGKRDSSFFLLMCERFLDSLVDFNDPFLWVKNNYVILDWIERQRYKDPAKNVEVKVTVSGDYPVFNLEDPRVVRDFIDYLVFASATIGTQTDPTKLDFSWDENLGAMVIVTDALDSLRGNPAWPDISGRLENLGGRTEGGRIILPLQTGAGTAGSGKIENLDDTTEIDAVPEDDASADDASSIDESFDTYFADEYFQFYPLETMQVGETITAML